MKGKVRGGRWRKMLRAEVDFVCPCRIRRMAAAQVPCSGRQMSGGHSGTEGEGERRCSQTENLLPKTGWCWVSADETGCSPPSERSPEINPLFPPPLLPPPPPPSSPQGPPRCHRSAQRAQGGSWCYASSETDPGSVWARSSAEACPPSRLFCPGRTGSPLCNRRSVRSPDPRSPKRRPDPGRSASSPGSAPLSCCGNICAGQPT